MAEPEKPKVASKRRAPRKKKTEAATKNNQPVAPSSPKSRGLQGWLLFAVVVIAVALLLYASGRDSGEQVVELENKTGLPAIGGPFELTDHNGNAVSNKTFAGKYMLVNFGFTYCPDVCPTGLTEISSTLELLGSEADKITPIFITVDPARDTPEQLKEYISFFHPRLVGLTGSERQIKSVTKAYRVYFAKVENKAPDADPEDYTVDHTALTYLMGPTGEFKQHFGQGTDAAQMAKRIKEIINP